MSEVTTVDITTTEQFKKHAIELFDPFQQQADEWLKKANEIVVTDSSQKDLMKEARIARLALRDIRVSVNNKHKELKEEYLQKGKALDEIKRKLVGLIEPIEDHLQKQEDFIIIQEEERKRKLKEERTSLLEPYMGSQVNFLQLGEMDEETFNSLLTGQKAAKELKEKQEAEAKIEAEKRRKEQHEENERIRIENKKLEEQNRKLQEAADKKKAEEEEEKKRQRSLKRAPDKVKLEELGKAIASIELPKCKDEEAIKITNNVNDLLTKVVTYIDKQIKNL